MYLRAVKQALCGCAKEETAATGIEKGFSQQSPALAQIHVFFYTLTFWFLLLSDIKVKRCVLSV